MMNLLKKLKTNVGIYIFILKHRTKRNQYFLYFTLAWNVEHARRELEKSGLLGEWKNFQISKASLISYFIFVFPFFNHVDKMPTKEELGLK